MGGRNPPSPPFFVRFRTLQEVLSKKEAAPKSGLSLGRKRPRRAYGDKSPRFVIYGAPHKKATGKSPKAQQKRVHAHYPRECDIFASKPSPSGSLGGCDQSFTISASHAPREFSDEIRPDARPAEGADGEA